MLLTISLKKLRNSVVVVACFRHGSHLACQHLPAGKYAELRLGESVDHRLPERLQQRGTGLRRGQHHHQGDLQHLRFSCAWASPLLLMFSLCALLSSSFSDFFPFSFLFFLVPLSLPLSFSVFQKSFLPLLSSSCLCRLVYVSLSFPRIFRGFVCISLTPSSTPLFTPPPTHAHTHMHNVKSV